MRLRENVQLEAVSSEVHRGWAHWTRYMLDNLTPENIARWHRQVDTDYFQLTEKEKESDREWARIYIAVSQGHCGKK